jgi:hypothetical protein
MDKILTFALALAVSLGTTALLAANGRALPRPNLDPQLATDGAFRDGMFVGRMAAARGERRHPLIGRWVSAADRASFAAGYERGYDDAFASANRGQMRH